MGDTKAASLNEATRLSVGLEGETGVTDRDLSLRSDTEDCELDDEVEECREKFGRKEVVMCGSAAAELANASLSFSILDFKFAFSL